MRNTKCPKGDLSHAKGGIGKGIDRKSFDSGTLRDSLHNRDILGVSPDWDVKRAAGPKHGNPNMIRVRMGDYQAGDSVQVASDLRKNGKQAALADPSGIQKKAGVSVLDKGAVAA